MIPGLKPMGAAEAGLRFMARRGLGDWMVLVVAPSVETAVAAEELADEMETAGGVAVARIAGATNAEDLAQRLAATRDPAIASGLDDWPASEWAHFDRLRSRFTRGERTALVLGQAAFESLAQQAPNFSSWLGASVMAYQPDASVLTDDERSRRLEALRAWAELSDDEVLARATAGTLPRDPEYAEWLVLLHRGDLLGR
jgi:hypothetical protein